MNVLHHSSRAFYLGAMALALALVGCKEERERAKVTTTASSAVVSPVTAPASPAAPKPVASTPQLPAKNVASKATKGNKVDKQNTLVISDVSEKAEPLSVCGHVDFEVVLPAFLDAPDWTVSAPKALGAPKQEVKKGFRGPSSDSVAFRWPGTNAEAGTYPVVFTSGTDKVTVRISVVPSMPCTESEAPPEGVVPEDERPKSKR